MWFVGFFSRLITFLPFTLLLVVITFLILVIYVINIIKRLHDINAPTTFKTFIIFIIICQNQFTSIVIDRLLHTGIDIILIDYFGSIGFLMLALAQGSPYTNKYGAPPAPNNIKHNIMFAISLVLYIGCFPCYLILWIAFIMTIHSGTFLTVWFMS